MALARWVIRGSHGSFWLALALGAAPALSGPAVAHAAEGERPLVVIVDAEDSAITRRLRQEIEALGFSVELLPEPPPLTMGEDSSAPRAVAVIEIKAARPGSVRLSIVDPKTTQVVRQALPIEAAHDPNSAELVATRTVELLRAARLTVRTQDPRSEDSVTTNTKPAAATPEPSKPAPPPSEPSPEPASQLLVGAGGGLSCVPEWTPGFDASLSVAWWSAGRWGLLAELTLPLLSCRLEGPNGDIDALANRYRFGAVFEAFRERPFALRMALGGELEQLAFRGRAQAPYVNAESHLLAFAPWVRVGGSLRIARSLRVVTALTGAWTVPRSVVNFAGREVSRWGRPGLTGSLGAEWSFP
jgi:hypothetical protein